MHLVTLSPEVYELLEAKAYGFGLDQVYVHPDDHVSFLVESDVYSELLSIDSDAAEAIRILLTSGR